MRSYNECLSKIVHLKIILQNIFKKFLINLLSILQVRVFLIGTIILALRNITRKYIIHIAQSSQPGGWSLILSIIILIPSIEKDGICLNFIDHFPQRIQGDGRNIIKLSKLIFQNPICGG